MSVAEELVFIPKNQIMKEQPYSSQILTIPRVQHTRCQFSETLQNLKVLSPAKIYRDGEYT